MRLLDLGQRTPEWLEWRKSGVSASEAAIVLGLSTEKTPWRLWAEKTGLVLPEDLSGNPNIQRGIRCEPVARRLFESRHDEILLPACAESLEHPFLRASFDGLTDDAIPVEIKCPTLDNFQEARANDTQSEQYRKHYAQIQQQIAIAGSDRGWLTLYQEETRGHLDFEVPRDDAFIANLVTEATRFADMLRRREEPPKDPLLDIFIPTGQDAAAWLEWAAEYRRLHATAQEQKAKLKRLDEQMGALQERFLAAMGGFAQGEYAGLRVNRYLQQGAVDYKAVLKRFAPAVTEDDLGVFRRPASERVRVTPKTEDTATVPFDIRALDAVFEDDWSF